jgi:hypothetical protein
MQYSQDLKGIGRNYQHTQPRYDDDRLDQQGITRTPASIPLDTNMLIKFKHCRISQHPNYSPAPPRFQESLPFP